MRVLKKKGDRAILLGEGRLFSKSQFKLKEDIDANIGTANGIHQAQMKARELMTQNPNVNSASADAGHIDGDNDSNSGEGLKLELPVNATGSQLAQAQRMTQNQNNDDMEITFTKPMSNGVMQGESRKIDGKRLQEMRNNSVSFTKKELSEFLFSL